VRRTAFIHDDPACTAHEPAHILNLPAATLKAWCFGQGYRSTSGARKQFQPVIRCAWSRRLGEALRSATIPFIAHREKFKPACGDAGENDQPGSPVAACRVVSRK